MRLLFYFKPTKANLNIGSKNYIDTNTKTVRMYRTKGWTTNGFWMIKSEYEPKVTKEVPEITINVPPIDRVLPDNNNDYEPLKIVNELKTGANTVCVKLQFPVVGKETNYDYYWVDVYFLALFESVTNRELTFKAKREGHYSASPVHVYAGEDLLGVVMPVRMDE